MARRFIDLKVEGSGTVIRTLQKAKVKVRDLEPAWQRIGAKVKTDAASIAPVLTGRTKASIRARKTKTRATIVAGRGNMPYPGVVHYGGYNNIQAHPYLTTALHRNAGFIERELQDELQDIIRRLRLGEFR